MDTRGERGLQTEEGDIQVMAGLWDSQGSRQLPAGQTIFGLGCLETINLVWEEFVEAMEQDFQ